MITYDDFKKLEIRIAEIKAADRIEGADRLLKLTVGLGKEKRTLVAGIADNYGPEQLLGKQVPILANLEPRKIRGVESNGMILAVSVDGRAVLMHPDRKVQPGSEVL